MRKQNYSLRNAAGVHVRWMSDTEIDRMVEAGQVRRISKRKDPRQVYQLIAVAEPDLTAERSQPALGRSDMNALHLLKPFEIARLTAEKVARFSPEKLARYQRLMGWNLVPFNQAVADAGDAIG